MLMATDEKALRPISTALSPEDFAFIAAKSLEIAATLEGCHRKRNAEVYPGVTPQWHVATVLPGKERIAAADLSDRCFGVYLPESEHTEIRRGRKVDLKRLMLPGYVLVFVWDVDRHLDRIRACDGVRGMLIFNGKVAVVPDMLVNRLRIAENTERPLKMVVEVVKKKKRWRQSHKSMEQREVTDNDIVAVHSYSPFIEAMRAEEEAERLSAFHKAIGLAA